MASGDSVGSRGAVHRAQLCLDRALGRLRSSGVLAEHDRRRHRAEGEEHGFLMETGRRQLTQLAGQFEKHLGVTLEGRTALDYGCGFGRLAVPLAERCERVYGLDVAPEVLAAAAQNAAQAGVANAEWMDARRLAELDGLYDLVISMYVFQHIPSREGERVFAQIVRGLRPGGAAAIHFALRPPVFQPRAREALSHAYMLMHSYSLNRLGAILASNAAVHSWHVKWQSREGRPYDAAIILFSKG